MNNKESGKKGEDIASNYLIEKGYSILSKNVEGEKGEIDIIALHNNTIVFVEVKLRSSLSYGTPEKAVSKQKQEKIRSVATEWLLSRNEEREIRFDIISILLKKGLDSIEEVYHIEDAFY